MAKTRAQRKAERRAREAEERKRSGSDARPRRAAQHDTQVATSGDVAEVEAVEAGIAAGAPEADLETPDAPKPSRADRRAEARAAEGSGEAPARRAEAARARATREEAETGQRRTRPARRRHRLPAFLLGRAEESPVARPRHADPGDRRHDPLRRRRRGLPRRPGRALQLADQADPLTRIPERKASNLFRWYVINTYSGHENKVKHNLEHRVETMSQNRNVRQVVVPTEQVSEMKDGQKVTRPRNGPCPATSWSTWR